MLAHIYLSKFSIISIFRILYNMLCWPFRDMPHSHSYSEIQPLQQPTRTSYQRRASTDVSANINGFHRNRSVLCLLVWCPCEWVSWSSSLDALLFFALFVNSCSLATSTVKDYEFFDTFEPTCKFHCHCCFLTLCSLLLLFVQSNKKLLINETLLIVSELISRLASHQAFIWSEILPRFVHISM